MHDFGRDFVRSFMRGFVRESAQGSACMTSCGTSCMTSGKSPASQYATTAMRSHTPTARCRQIEATGTRYHAYKYL